ncbi:MAG: acetate/propionate family kinase [Terrimicrobiaceae bacterium]
MANVLVLNAGSGSQKTALYSIDPDPEGPSVPVWQAAINSTTPGQPPEAFLAQIKSTRGEGQIPIPRDWSLQKKIRALIRASWEGSFAVLEGSHRIDLIGHRVVHGGLEFSEAVLVTPRVEATIDRLGEFAPLHNPVNLEGIRACREALGDEIPQFAVFDTAFHRTLPQAATTYAGPYEWVERGFVRYGFHGTSYRYASRRASEIINRQHDEDLCQILCHLGGGCSLAAVRGTRCVDTTMGFTPLDGIAMCTRSGTIDPGIMLHLLRHGTDVDSLEQILNKQSGLSGLSGLPGDTRVIFPKARENDRRAKLAMDVFIHRLRAGIGSMLASLGRLDALVFTDVIGETEPVVRQRACDAFGFLGLRLDDNLNASSLPDTDIATKDSSVRVVVVHGEENWQIAAESVEAWHR